MIIKVSHLIDGEGTAATHPIPSVKYVAPVDYYVAARRYAHIPVLYW